MALPFQRQADCHQPEKPSWRWCDLSVALSLRQIRGSKGWYGATAQPTPTPEEV